MGKKALTPLWSIHSSQGQVSYLFGTMHVRDHRAFRYFDTLKPYIASCDELYTEISFADLSDTRLFIAQRLPEGMDLAQLFGPKKFTKAEKVLRKHFNFELAQVGKILPMVIVNQLISNDLGQDHTDNLDLAIYRYAQEQGKRLKGLETIEEHIGILTAIPLELQKAQFMGFVRQPKKLRKKTPKLADMYYAGDIYQLYKQSKNALGKMRKPMIYDRNHLMASRITANMNTSAVYAVGTGHLPGKYGLLKLLKDNGLKLKPIFP